MNKSHAAVLVAGLVAGATSSSFLTSATREGTKFDVQTVSAVRVPQQDGGLEVQVETCGIVNKHDGLTPMRWCDRRHDACMDKLVAGSVDRLQGAQQIGEKRNTEAQAKLEVIRQRQASEAEKRRQERVAARDAGQPVPGQTP
jgi:hypothetical protein